MTLDYEDLTQRIIGCYYDVYNELGVGFHEISYRKAMVIALGEIGLKSVEETPVEVFFRQKSIGHYKTDMIVEGTVILELKTLEKLTSKQEKQLLNYLAATPIEIGLLFNFGGEKPEFRRMVFSNARKKAVPCNENQIRTNPRDPRPNL